MTPRLDEYDLLVADSSVLFRFFEAGAAATKLMMAHCASRLYIVHDVNEEINDHEDAPSMKEGIRVFREMLETEVIVLPGHLVEQVAVILHINRRLGEGAKKDMGETATVVYADWAWEAEQQEFLVLMRDRIGGYLAEDRGVGVMLPDEMVLDLVCGKAMTPEEGEAVWVKIFTKNLDIDGYYAKIKKHCPAAL